MKRKKNIQVYKCTSALEEKERKKTTKNVKIVLGIKERKKFIKCIGRRKKL